ncbi:MAG: AAA family ATPase, partial [Candidatus Eremiobacteraeota bacterium]|nr:AAA family ATPase [Candidatus Eremiobacteraeota bacterium]
MKQLELKLLGPVRVVSHDSAQTMKSSKTQALLAIVGTERKPVTRNHLASLLWETFPQERAWANLRHALHKLKKQAPELLEITEEEVRLGATVRVDIQDPDSFETGEFCQGLELGDCPSFESWLLTQRGRWRDRAVQALLQKAEASESPDHALELAHQALTQDPLCERAHAAVIRLLRERGDFAAARRQWDICLRTTLQELGSVPSILSCWGPALEEDAPCKIYLLGQPKLMVNGAITALPYQKTTALLTYLASHGEAVDRQFVREMFWPGSRPDKAAANLRHALHFLRKSVGDVLCSHDESLWLDRSRLWLDTDWLKKSGHRYSSVGLFCEGLSLPDCPEFENWLLEQRRDLDKTPAPQKKKPPAKNEPRGNLPAQLSSLVGASESLQEAQRALADSRLLTLIGPAGVGKTRLALELGRIHQQRKPVWLVEYGSLFDSERVMPRLAAALGISEVPGEDLWQQLEEEYRDRETLVVLDNCEHLITATAELAWELLKRLPKLQLIATSRELLRVPGETVLTLAPLPVPPKGAETVEQVSRFASVELFLNRARASRPQFQLKDDNAALVAEICRRLDGLPLAIELAAVRTRALSTKQIADGLRDRFRLLRGGPRTVPQRQQTLEQALAWSYNLLTEEERSVFCKLSVLAGFDLDAASSVCSMSHEPEYLLDTLSALIDRSLVICRESEEGFRYGMLETVRDFAFRELERTDEAEAVRDKHFQFFLNKACHRAQPGIAGLGELTADHANFGLALDWALQSPTSDALSLAAALGDYWFYGGHFTEGADYLDRALQQGECPKVLLWNGRLNQAQGDYARAQQEFERSADLAQEPLDQARALNARAQAGFSQADYLGSRHFAESALEIWKQEQHPRGEVDTLNLMVSAEICLGEWDRARRHLETSNRMASKLRYDWGASMVSYLEGLSALYQGDFDASRESLERSLEQCRRLDSQPRTAVCLGNLGLCALALDLPEQARGFIDEGRELAAACGYKQVEAFLLYCDGFSRKNENRRARSLLQKSLQLMQSIGVKESVELVLLSIAATIEEAEISDKLRQAALSFKACN